MFECRIEKDSHPDATVLRIRGEIDQRTSDAFGEHLAAIAADGHHVIVDLSEVDYFDASGLRFLDIVQQRSRAQGRLLLLVSPPPHIQELLAIMHLEDALPIAGSVDQAAGWVRAYSGDGQMPTSGDQAEDARQVMPWKLRMHVDTDPHALRIVRKLLGAMARIEGAKDKDMHLIEVAVGEVLANTRLHAYRNGIGPIEVTTEFDGTRFAVTIRNHGEPVSGQPVIPESRSGQDARGWGLYMIGQIMDEVEIVQLPSHELGTAVRMVKLLNSSPQQLMSSPDSPQPSRRALMLS